MTESTAPRMRQCRACLEVIPASDFANCGKGRKDAYCLPCKRARNKRYRAKYEAMNIQQAQVVIAGLDARMRKVLEAVPLKTYWSSKRIGHELFSRNIRMTGPFLQSSLHHLREKKLIVRVGVDTYTRLHETEAVQATTPAQIAPKKETQAVTKTAPLPTQDKGKPATDRILAAAIRMGELGESMKALSAEIVSAIDEVERREKDCSQHEARMAMLRTAFGDIFRNTEEK